MMLNSGLWDAQWHYIDVIFASTVNFYSNLFNLQYRSPVYGPEWYNITLAKFNSTYNYGKLIIFNKAKIIITGFLHTLSLTC